MICMYVYLNRLAKYWVYFKMDINYQAIHGKGKKSNIYCPSAINELNFNSNSNDMLHLHF